MAPPGDLQSDVFIGIYWQRYGRVSDGMEVSGLEEEFLLSGTEGLPRLLYVKTPRPTASPAWPSCWPCPHRGLIPDVQHASRAGPAGS